MNTAIKSVDDIKQALEHNISVMEPPVSPKDKRRKFKGSTTYRGYGPVFNPSLMNTMSSEVGGAGQMSLPAPPPGGAPAAGPAPGGAVMSSVDTDESMIDDTKKLPNVGDTVIAISNDDNELTIDFSNGCTLKSNIENFIPNQKTDLVPTDKQLPDELANEENKTDGMFESFLLKFKPYDSSLIEAINKAYNIIYK